VPPIILTILQALFLLLLYVFVARAVRWVVRDVATTTPTRTVSRSATGGARSASSPRRRKPRSSPRELVVHAPNARPRVLPLADAEITFGRAGAASVVLDDGYVSETHARVYRDGDDWLVADAGSTNGTFLNQVKVTAPTPLAAGDQLGIGKTVVEVRR
jgi:pSer/pThr/pTyr-binding forkhead associated (FHA) protein